MGCNGHKPWKLQDPNISSVSGDGVKKQVKCDEKCPGLDEKGLALHPGDTHLFRLANLITVDECYRVVTWLGLSTRIWNNIQNKYRYEGLVMKGVAFCQWRDEKEKKDMSKPSFQELFDVLAKEKKHHVLCQLFTEDVTDHEIANSALQEIPEDDVLHELSRNVGPCAMHLGVELGLSVAAIEGICLKNPNNIFKQTLGVMEEWKSSSKVRPTIPMLMKAFQWADRRGLMFLKEKYIVAQFPKMGTSDEIRVDKELLSKGTFNSYDNCVFLAGACNVGKSTLARVLIGEEISQHWESTDGLTIYFGRNGIDLKNKEMVPLKQDFDGDALPKVLRGKPDMTQEKPDTTLSKNREEVLPHDSNKGNIISETHTVTQRTDITLSTSTAPTPSLIPGTGKDDVITTIQEDIKEKIRKGRYKIDIAPSDLVDFGGQRSFDMTHQLFMRRKGTFVLMFNGRIDFLVPLEEYKQGETTESILKHWVNSILSYCADDDDILPIIMFCATHSDDFNPEDRKDRKKKLIHDLGEIFKTHKRQHRIIYDDIFFINGQDKNDLEINKLKFKLVEVACKQKSWGKRVPMAWVPLDLQMSELRLHNMNIISKEELITLNKRNEDLAMTDEQIKYFLNDRHSLGKIVYFDQDGLDNFIVVQPQSLVNILRSFITAELFWPEDKELKGIHRALTDTGKITKQDLLKLWLQKKFHQDMPNDDFKEFIIQVLVHLDILVELGHRQEQESKVQSYLVPCIVKRRLPVTDFYVRSADKMICLSYTLLKSSIPAALSFKLIGAAINHWPIKETPKGICLYHQAAILCIDGSNELHILVADDKVFVYLINKDTKRSISPNIASVVQECLTLTMKKVLEFYHKSFGKSLYTLDVSEAFEIEVGEWCTAGGGCYISVPELEKETEWTCKNNKKHGKTYPRYWIFDKGLGNVVRITRMKQEKRYLMMVMEISKNRNLITLATTKRDRTCQPTFVTT